MSTMTGEGLKSMPIAAAPRPEAMVHSSGQREIAEVQAAIFLARQFPRDEAVALERIKIACQRPGLAEAAMYQYARGGSDITGPSIRLAEAIAQEWGNLQFGVREIEQRPGESTVEAFAWDMERNVRQVKTFQVKHTRYTRRGAYALDDPRDIYELTANQGARRVRACILGLIPGDVVDAAMAQCEETLKAKADTSPAGIKKMLAAFEKFEVTREQIETRLQRKLDAITAAQMIGLMKVYNSLKDGMSVASDWFEVPEKDLDAEEAQASATERLKSKLKRGDAAPAEEGSAPPEEASPDAQEAAGPDPEDPTDRRHSEETGDGSLPMESR